MQPQPGRPHRILRSSKSLALLASLLAVLALSAISHARLLDPNDADHWPHVMRSATVPTATMGTTFLNADDVGHHTYTPDGTEKTGIIYTCRGGHVDIAHLRKAADWTANIASKAYDNIRNGYVQFSYKLYEPSVYQVTLAYPENWATMPRDERDRVAFEVATALAQHCAYTSLTWHEVLTWFGYKTLYVLSEFESAFSWEDTFSNLLGTHLAVQALRDPDRSFDDAMTKLLKRHKQGTIAAVVPEPLASLVRHFLLQGELGDLWKVTNGRGNWEVLTVEPREVMQIQSSG